MDGKRNKGEFLMDKPKKISVPYKMFILKEFAESKGWQIAGLGINNLMYKNPNAYYPDKGIYIPDREFKGSTRVSMILQKMDDIFYPPEISQNKKRKSEQHPVMFQEYRKFALKYVEENGDNNILNNEVFEEDEKQKHNYDGRLKDGRFAQGNKIGMYGSQIGVKSMRIRQHRQSIDGHVDTLIEMLVKEAIDNKNMQVAMWLVGKVVPDSKPSTFVNSKMINKIQSLEELKQQAAQSIQDGVEGESSLEETSVLMSLYKEHKSLIEAADIEPLANAIKSKLGR